MICKWQTAFWQKRAVYMLNLNLSKAKPGIVEKANKPTHKILGIATKS